MAGRRETDADVLVVGAGLAGLLAARAVAETGLRPLVLEREDEPGGRARSEPWAGCTIDVGASFVVPEYSRVLGLLEELGLAERLRPVTNAFRSAIRRDGEWHHLDFARPASAGLTYGGLRLRERVALTRLLPALLRGVRSVRFADVASAAAVDGRTTESVIGRGANRYLISPPAEVLTGSRPEEISLALTQLGARFPIRRPWTVEGGIGALASELGRSVGAQCGVAVERVRFEGGSAVAEIADGREVRGRGVVLATRGDESAELWSGAPDETRRFLAAQRYTHGFGTLLRTSAPVGPTDPRSREVYLEIVPRGEGTRLLQAVAYMNDVVEDGGLIGVTAYPEVAEAEEDDAGLAAALEAELASLHPELAPKFAERMPLRWPVFMPAYPVGRARELAAFRARLAPGPVQLAGDYLYGPFMEAAVRSGEEAAGRVAEYLN